MARLELVPRDAREGICTQCGKPCQALVPQSNPKAAEFYCARCHKSYPHPIAQQAMDEDDAA